MYTDTEPRTARPRRKPGQTPPPPRRPKAPIAAKTDANGRMRIVFGILTFIGFMIICKLLYLQLIDAENLKKKAQKSRNQSLALFNRGRLLDRNGMVLAQDTVLYDMYAHPKYYWNVKPHQIATALSPILATSETKLTQKLSEPYFTIGVKKNLEKKVVEQISKARLMLPAIDPKTKEPILNEDGTPVLKKTPLPGLDFNKKTVRNYPQGTLAAHILGYVNDEAGISSGVEYTWAHVLKKRPADMSQTVLDGHGDLVEITKVNPKNLVSLPQAQDIKLTIDARLQYIAERELAAGLKRSNAPRGAVIMMNPKNGEILAFAVQPTYQPDQFDKASADHLKNWAITDVYPPGSTFKILTVACGLESGVINKNSKIHDSGMMTIGGWPIKNYDYGKHGAPGNIDLVYLFQHSSNIASAKISMMIPKEQHHLMLRKIGIGSKTGIELPGESRGIILPTKQWDISTHATIGFGYGTAATPMQMAAGVASLANGGIWTTPHLIKNSPYVKQRRVFSKQTADTVTDLLAESIRTAKTSTVRLEEMEVAGKTGTSRKPRENGRGYDANVFTSFVGYFPAKKPEVLIMVVVDSPKMGEAWGSTVAGPIFKNIAKETISYLGLNAVKMASRGSSGKPVPGSTALGTPTSSPAPVHSPIKPVTPLTSVR